VNFVSSDILIFSCGSSFCVYISKNGIFSWGFNNYGQLGIGNKINHQSSPQPILFFKNPEEILSLSCGVDFCMCICTNGVFSWGKNDSGQLGIGNEDDQSSPQRIQFFKNPEDIISLSCGYHFSICICKNGVFAWGANYSGQLGIGNAMNQSSPQHISFFKHPEEIVSLSCGWNFCICVCKNGVFGWGGNRFGQLGIGHDFFRSSPQQIEFFKNPEDIISLSCGSHFCVCVCKNGVFSWGKNYFGQLGLENSINQSSPQQITFFLNPEDIISLSCGSHFCVCICKNGLVGWGCNDDQVESDPQKNIPRHLSIEKTVENFYNLSFPQYSMNRNTIIKKYSLILAKELFGSNEFLLRKNCSSMDIFEILFHFF
jgi:alpha-tubulin suppressor-like RCC1 family protein